MKPIRLALPLLFATAFAFAVAAPAQAGSSIEVTHPWARPTIPNRPGVVYLGIENTGAAADRLTGASAEGVGKAELHKSEQKGDMMTMAPVDGIDIPAGGTVELAPRGYHIMLFDIAKPLTAGDTVALTLDFEKAGAVSVSVPVKLGNPSMLLRRDETEAGTEATTEGTEESTTEDAPGAATGDAAEGASQGAAGN